MLTPGQKLGPYEIVSSLGAGGMGEVYRARDGRLGRDVAIKVLPAHLADDPDALARFEREMKTIGALSHPNILAIYDVGRDGTTAYAVTELLEGETLGEMIARGPVPVRKAVDYGIQIARALDAAHERNIVHRDLKPENVFVVTGGHLKVLDFGLARDVHALAAETGNTATTLTRPGLVMGTVGYMAPEQARGLAVDHRADLFAFGCVMYELVTGRRAFQRDTPADTFSAILNADPPPLTIGGAAVPPALERVILRCLEKNPAERFQSARDLAFALETVTTISGTTSGHMPAAAPPKQWMRGAIAGLLLIAAAAGGWTLARLRSPAPPGGPPHLQRLTFEHGIVRSARFAPDGQTIVYGAAWNGGPYRVFVTRTDSGDSNALDLPPADVSAISPSGDMLLSIDRHIVLSWVMEGTLARVRLLGSGPREILEHVQEADFLPNDAIAVVTRANGRDRLEAPQGTVVFETPGYISHVRVSPEGKRIAFNEHPVYGDNRGFVDVYERGKVRRITREYSGIEGLAWSADGRELWFGGTPDEPHWSVMAAAASGDDRQDARRVWSVPRDLVPLDIDARGRLLVAANALSGSMAGVLAGETTGHQLGWRSWSLAADLSQDARTVLFTNMDTLNPEYDVLVRRGDSAPVIIGTGWAQRLSPDARTALSITPAQPHKLMLLPTGAGQPRQLDTGTLVPGAAVFADGGSRVLVAGLKDGAPVATLIDLAGGARRDIDVSPLGARVNFANNNNVLYGSPDGSRFAVVTDDARVMELAVNGSRTARELAALGVNERFVGWAADNDHLYVVTWDGPKGRVERLDLTSGRRSFVREIVVPDPGGMLLVPWLRMGGDGQSYVYSFTRMESTLYLVTGLR